MADGYTALNVHDAKDMSDTLTTLDLSTGSTSFGATPKPAKPSPPTTRPQARVAPPAGETDS